MLRVVTCPQYEIECNVPRGFSVCNILAQGVLVLTCNQAEFRVFHSVNMDDVEGFRLQVQDLGRPCRVLSDSDRNDVRCIGSAINEYCERKCRRLCQAAVGFKQPLLSCYQSDGWFRVISQYVTEAVDGKRFKREVENSSGI